MRRGDAYLALVGVMALVLGACAPQQATTTTAAPATLAPATTGAGETTTTPATETTEAALADLARLSYRLDFLAGPPHIPYVWGATSGIYEQHGLDLRVLEGRGSALTFQIVASGADPLGNVDGGVYALGKAQTPEGGTMVGVWTQENPADLLFSCDQNIEEPTDVRGKTIAAAPGDAVVALLPALLSAHGMTMDDVSVISVAPAARVTTVIEGDADIGVGFGHASSIRYILAGQEAGVEICHLRLSDWGVNTLGHGTMVNSQFMEQNPDLVRAFVEATQEAIQSGIENPEAAVDAITEYFPTTAEERETMEIGLEVFNSAIFTDNSEGCPIGWVSQVDAETTISLLSQYLGLETDLSAGDFYTNEFVGECEGREGV